MCDVRRVYDQNQWWALSDKNEADLKSLDCNTNEPLAPRHNTLLLRAPSRGDNLSFLGVIGSVEKFPLVDLQLYFLIFKPEFTWILGHFRTF